MTIFLRASAFPATPSAALEGEPLANVPGWGARDDAWPSPESLSEHPPLFSSTDDEEPLWSQALRPKRSPLANSMMAAYDALDTLWRLNRWVDEQGPGARVSWAVEYPPDDNLDDPSDPSPPGPPFLSISKVTAAGKPENHWLYGMEETLASVLQMACRASYPSGSFDAHTPVEERVRSFAGPAMAQWWKNQELQRTLPAPHRPRVPGLRF